MGRRSWLALVAVVVASGSSASGAGVSQRASARLGPPPAPSGIRVAWLADLGVLISDGGGRHRFSIDEVLGNDSGLFGMPSWSPDGTTVAYWSWDTKAGQAVTVAYPRGKRHGFLMRRSDGATGFMGFLDAPERTLTRPRLGRAAPMEFWLSHPEPVAWSSDGKRIAFARRDHDVEIVNVRTRRSRILPTRQLIADEATPGYDWVNLRPVWAPRGRYLALISNMGSGAWIADLESGSIARFAPRGARIRYLAWSPDGTKLAYSRGDARGNGQILIATVDGRRVARLTNDVPTDRFAHLSNTHPAWSPDGSKVAFLSNRDGAHDNELFVIGADGRNERRLTRGTFVEPPLRWSPDGTRIAFLDDGHYRLRVAQVKGGGRIRRLMKWPAEYRLECAPFSFAWTGKAARPRPRPLPRTPPPNPVSTVREHAPLGRTRIVDVRLVARPPSSVRTGTWDDFAALSPDGSKLAFVRGNTANPFFVGVLDLASGTKRVLARGAAVREYETGPVFSPDGRELLFRQWSGLAAVDITTGTVRQVVDRAGPGDFFWLRDGRIAYLGPDGRLLIVRPGKPPQSVALRIGGDSTYAPSPDGSRVLYFSACRTWLLDRGHGTRRIVGYDLWPRSESWSPDGRLFVVVRRGATGSCYRFPGPVSAPDALLYDEHGKRVANLLGLREPDGVGFSPRWSTDGRWLLVTAGSGGTHPPPGRVYAYSVARGKMTRVLHDDLRMVPFVGPGGWVVFGRDPGRPPDYSRLPIQLGRLSDG
jgi:Tol biopolymer transport system component